MLLGEILKVAVESIRVNKLRSFLTMLGIIIGIAAVITMVALGEGAQRAVQDRIAGLGANVLTVRPGQNFFGGVDRGQARLTTKDAEAIVAGARSIRAVAPALARTRSTPSKLPGPAVSTGTSVPRNRTVRPAERVRRLSVSPPDTSLRSDVRPAEATRTPTTRAPDDAEGAVGVQHAEQGESWVIALAGAFVRLQGGSDGPWSEARARIPEMAV